MQDTIAVVFDFDDTLAPESTSSFLESLGVDVRHFWAHKVRMLLDEGWDPVPAYLYRMLELSNSGEPATIITRDKLRSWGRQVHFYNGVTHIFNRLKKCAKSVNPNVSVEFYMVSSGIGKILRSTRIAKRFEDIWACEFAYDSKGRISFPRNVVSFTDKTRFLFHVSKGIFGAESRAKPFEVNRKIPPQELRIPLDQMIFVGDGYTDVPCFSLLRKHNGVPIGVYDPDNEERWGRAWGFIEDERVLNLVPVDYGTKSALSNSLVMAVQGISNRIARTYKG